MQQSIFLTKMQKETLDKGKQQQKKEHTSIQKLRRIRKTTREKLKGNGKRESERYLPFGPVLLCTHYWASLWLGRVRRDR